MYVSIPRCSTPFFLFQYPYKYMACNTHHVGRIHIEINPQKCTKIKWA